jgi:hypothetical protein
MRDPTLDAARGKVHAAELAERGAVSYMLAFYGRSSTLILFALGQGSYCCP